MKEQTRNTEVQINKEDKLPEKEFRTIIVKKKRSKTLKTKWGNARIS